MKTTFPRGQAHGRVDEDQVVVIQHAVRIKRVCQRIPQLPSAALHAPNGDLELCPIQVQLRANQVDIGPVCVLDQVGSFDVQSLGQCVVERQRRIAAINAPLVVGL